MGIPHLSHQLQPHGAKVVLARAPVASAGQIPTIVDGPSLAYQCFHACMSRSSGCRNAYEAAPSYKELGEAAVAWLEQIEQFGFNVKAIFFDGLLPPSKKPTRLSRLQNYANQLVAFRALNKEDLPARLSKTTFSKSDLLSTASASARLKALPAPSFLVPAVIEALLSSKYKGLTSVIPGEADAYCAQSARDIGGTILTSDSDLLVHDLGQAGKVILFKDIESIHLPSKGKCLKTQQYQPSVIAEKFGLPNLVRLAFFMSEDNHRSFADATRLAKERNPTSNEFTEFEEQYASLPVLSSLAEEYLSRSERLVFKLLIQMDPRISELIHQVLMKTRTAKLGADRALDMSLPFLIDDPTRTSAWRAGSEIRSLAYSLLRLLDQSITQINEHERKGTRISDTVLSLCSPEELLGAARTISEDLSTPLATENQKGLSPASKWRAIAAKLVCKSNLDCGKAAPSASDLTRLVTSSREGVLSWSYIHTSAQLQAVLYSMRLLLQIARVVLAFMEEKAQDAAGVGAEVVRELVNLLDNLPGLADLFDETSQPNSDETALAKVVVFGMLQAQGVNDESTEKSSTKKSRKKRKKNGDHAVETTPPAWRQNNMFGSLAQ